MKNELTINEFLKLDVVKNEWLDKFFKSSELDYKECINGIYWLYEFSKLEKPFILFFNSPYECQLAANYIKLIFKNLNLSQVWSQVGSQVESQVWSQVESQVGLQVGSQVRLQVRSQVESQVWSQVRSQVWSQVWSQVESQVWSQVRLQVRSQVESQVESQVGLQVGSPVRSQVGSQLLEYFSFSSCGNIYDFGWISFYSYFQKIGIKLKNSAFNKFKDLLNSGIYDSIQLNGFCIVSKKPSLISRNLRNQLHSETSYAIEFGDNYKLCYWNGVCVSEKLIKTPDLITKEDILGESNAEIRRCYREKLGAKKYYDLLSNGKGLELIDEDKDEQGFPMKLYSTFVKDKLLNSKVQFIEVICPSTERVYNIYPVKQDCSNVWEAKASTFNLKQKDFHPLIET